MLTEYADKLSTQNANIISKNIFVIPRFLHATIEILYGENTCVISNLPIDATNFYYNLYP